MTKYKMSDDPARELMLRTFHAIAESVTAQVNETWPEPEERDEAKEEWTNHAFESFICNLKGRDFLKYNIFSGPTSPEDAVQFMYDIRTWGRIDDEVLKYKSFKPCRAILNDEECLDLLARQGSLFKAAMGQVFATERFRRFALVAIRDALATSEEVDTESDTEDEEEGFCQCDHEE